MPDTLSSSGEANTMAETVILTLNSSSRPSFFPLLAPPKAKTEKNKCIELRFFTFSQEKRIKERHFSVAWSPKSLKEVFEEDCCRKVKSFFTEQ